MTSWLHMALSTPRRILKQCGNEVQQVSNCIQKLDIKNAKWLRKGRIETTKTTFRDRSTKTVSAIRIFLLLSKEALTWSVKYLLTRTRCSNSVWH